MGVYETNTDEENIRLIREENDNAAFEYLIKKYMEIVSIEKKTFEELVAKFDRFVRRMDAICHRHGEKKMSEWMDNQDVCRMLNISPRTLQTLRDNGTLAYSQINHKTYYRPEDVQRIVSIVEDRRKEARFKGRTI